jgi:5-methylcytosine-specific restriction enzyme A
MPNDKFYYTVSWINLRNYKLLINPMCNRCQSIATEIHHIKEKKYFPELALDYANLESLCKPCHSKHTIKENKKNWRVMNLKY